MTVATHSFSGTLSYEIIPRRPHAERRQPPPPSQPPSAGVNWHRLAAAAWQHEGQELHGRLPRGLSAQQFHAKVRRAAKRAGGEIGVQVRGEEWWIWSRRPGRVAPGKAGAPKGAARGRVVNSRWQGLWEALRRANGAPVRVEGVLDRVEQNRLTAVARRRQGIEVACEVRGEYTLVQEIGATR